MRSLKQYIFQRLKSFILTQNYYTPSCVIKKEKAVNISGNYLNGNITFLEHCKVIRSELNGTITIGRFTTLNGPNIDIYAGNGKVEIGNFCSIARNVSFQVDAHNYNKITTSLIYKNLFNESNTKETITSGDIIVGHDVWIGGHSIIIGNVTIGNGAVIAANSVVNKNIPPYAIVAGSPAKIIKYRFNNESIEKLQALNWWNWNIEQIHRNKILFKDEFDLTSLTQVQD